VLEDLTSNVTQLQDNEILTLNANTNYLQSFFRGRFDKEIFKKNVPVVTYDDPSNVISAQPITGFVLSSGTSGGAQKMMPWNEKYLDSCMIFGCINVKNVEKGKAMMFYFTKLESITPSGLPARVASSSYLKSNYFKNRPSNWYYTYTSPDELTLCPDNKQNLYCHLLCGLVQRNEVTRMGSIFASVMKELWSNIRSGQLSEWITDIVANTIEKICNQKCWKGIVTRLWPKAKYIETIVTGSMVQYVPTLNYYSNDMLPLISTIYASSETQFGLNLNPMCKPEDVSYTFMPNVSYFEFIPVDGDKNNVVDLADVKLGCSYEAVVTNFRIRVGDILVVTGFHNKAPQFRFIRRDNVVLSIDLDKTNEDDLFKAVNRGKLTLDSSDLMLAMLISPLSRDKNKDKKSKKHIELKQETFSECCLLMEDSLDEVYKNCRFKEEWTFDSLMDFFISQGASIGQYKTPRCIKSAKALEVIEKMW
ncbi:hypothetical protein ARALYDRAFT_472573, partial [Arabidopsis lyrata subsp. lyrata]